MKFKKFQKPRIGFLRKTLVLSVTSLKIAKHRLQKQKEHLFLIIVLPVQPSKDRFCPFLSQVKRLLLTPETCLTSEFC